MVAITTYLQYDNERKKKKRTHINELTNTE